MEVLNEATKLFAKVIKQQLGERVLGPSIPGIGRIRGQYILTMLIKLERNNDLIHKAKKIIAEATEMMKSEKGFSSVHIIVDVDPV
jgi:primosomal protein N' (replication factor Y) (superfamily II helicase)